MPIATGCTVMDAQSEMCGVASEPEEAQLRRRRLCLQITLLTLGILSAMFWVRQQSCSRRYRHATREIAEHLQPVAPRRNVTRPCAHRHVRS